MVEYVIWASVSVRIIRNECPSISRDVIHVKVTLKEENQMEKILLEIKKALKQERLKQFNKEKQTFRKRIF